MRYICLILSVAFASCSLFTHLKTRPFQYRANGSTYTISLQVPKGYSSNKNTTDSAGNQVQFYYYPNGSFFYTAYVNDTANYQPIDTSRNMPLLHPDGGLIYKGLKNGLYWRKIRLDNGLVYGYGKVPKANEITFDRAVDFSSLEKPQSR